MCFNATISSLVYDLTRTPNPNSIENPAMAFSSCPTNASPLGTSAKDHHRPNITAALRASQMKDRNVLQMSPRNFSRRDALTYMTAVATTTFIHVAPAEARNVKTENRRKIWDKLSKMREEAQKAKHGVDSANEDKGDGGTISMSEVKPPNPATLFGKFVAPTIEATI